MDMEARVSNIAAINNKGEDNRIFYNLQVCLACI